MSLFFNLKFSCLKNTILYIPELKDVDTAFKFTEVHLN